MLQETFFSCPRSIFLKKIVYFNLNDYNAYPDSSCLNCTNLTKGSIKCKNLEVWWKIYVFEEENAVCEVT